MKIEKRELYKYIGCVVRISESDEIPNGDYLIVETNEDYDTLWDIKLNKIVEGDPEGEIRYLYTSVNERVYLLREALVSRILSLMNEGWKLDSDGLDLSPLLEKLKIVETIVEEIDEKE